MEQKDRIYANLLRRFTEMSRKILGDNLVGVYLHGSAAMGCFHPKKSDLDLILVVETEIPDSAKMEFMKQVIKFNEEAPAKGLELSIVKKEVCKPFVYPTPYELHFSISHLKWFQEKPEEYIEKMKGTDQDLAAHFTIINHYGITLYGEKREDVFGEVPKSDYIDSIWFDVENAREDILEDPMYMTLNLCRVLAYLKEGRVLSKKAGGEWGLNSLPEGYRLLPQKALQCYESEEEMKVDAEDAQIFVDYMITEIQTEYCRM